ncbi:MAG: hypothetical protein ACFBSG_01405 [Leptolyngbyaceae cyanobacterium]
MANEDIDGACLIKDDFGIHVACNIVPKQILETGDRSSHFGPQNQQLLTGDRALTHWSPSSIRLKNLADLKR